MSPSVAFYTLGCKVNQYDTQFLMQRFKERGFSVVDFDEPADVYVVNSCAVTNRSVSRSRQAVRSALKRNPRALLVMTGCFPQVFPGEAAAMEEVGVVTGTADRDGLPDLVNVALREGRRVVKVNRVAQQDAPCGGIRGFLGRTRAFLKVQEGCQEFCTYCIVPYARGPMRSRPGDEVLREAEMLAEAGFAEIILTGTHLAAYSWSGWDLSVLLKKLEGIRSIRRIRLSSVEPLDVTSALTETMARSSKVCHHLHLPLQSGSDRILERMNRKYDRARFLELVASLRELMPDIGISTDVMVGFPGETDEDFQLTRAFVQECRFSRLHVFRFSPRPGTPAAHMKDQVPPDVKSSRATRLIADGRQLALEFAASFVGRPMEVLVEEEKDEGNMIGFTGNYIRVRFDGSDELAGRIVKVCIVVPGDKVSEGRLCEESCGESNDRGQGNG